MNTVFLICVLIFSLYGEGFSFLNGFPKEQCNDMDPTKIKVDDSMIKELESHLNKTPNSSPIVLPKSLQLSGSLNLYRIATSSPKYRRGRTLDITIRGPEFNAMMLQVRQIGADERRGAEQEARVGEFVSWPSSLQPVKCDKDQVTAVTNKNYLPKSGITIKWKAPKDDVGDVHVVARFMAGEEYWQLTESREIPLSEFPVNLKNCGKAKSCILYSEGSPSCHEDTCDYILTYNVVNTTSIEMVLGGTASGDQSYLAVGFSTSSEAETMKMIACTRAKTVAEIKFFALHKDESSGMHSLQDHPMHLENKKMDIDGDRIWCSFVAPMVTPEDEENIGLDFSVPMYQVYMRGKTNYTKGANIPILPAKLLISKKEIPMDKIKLQYHTMEKSSMDSGADVLTAFHALLLFVQLLYFQHIKNPL